MSDWGWPQYFCAVLLALSLIGAIIDDNQGPRVAAVRVLVNVAWIFALCAGGFF